MQRQDHGQDEGLHEVEETGSYGEKQIARMLRRHGMRFFYEHPVAVRDRGKVRVWYSDFWLPDVGIALEYAGIRGSEDYRKGIEHKKAVYQANGLSCVFLDLESMRGYWPGQVIQEILRTLEARLAYLDALDEQRNSPRE